MTPAQTLDDAILGAATGDKTAAANLHPTMVHVPAGVVAIGTAESATGFAVIAAYIAVIATIGRGVGRVVAFNVAVLATGGTAANHVVAEEPATVAVSGATLVAIGSVATGAPVATHTAFLARLAASQDSDNCEKANANNELHGQTGAILDRSP